MKSKSLFDQFLTLNRQAFDKGQFDAAYHALAGALHDAVDCQEQTGR